MGLHYKQGELSYNPKTGQWEIYGEGIKSKLDPDSYAIEPGFRFRRGGTQGPGWLMLSDVNEGLAVELARYDKIKRNPAGKIVGGRRKPGQPGAGTWIELGTSAAVVSDEGSAESQDSDKSKVFPDGYGPDDLPRKWKKDKHGADILTDEPDYSAANMRFLWERSEWENRQNLDPEETPPSTLKERRDWELLYGDPAEADRLNAAMRAFEADPTDRFSFDNQDEAEQYISDNLGADSGIVAVFDPARLQWDLKRPPDVPPRTVQQEIAANLGSGDPSAAALERATFLREFENPADVTPESLFVKGDLDLAADLRDFLNAPTPEARLRLAQEIARSPGDYMTMLAHLSGELPAPQFDPKRPLDRLVEYNPLVRDMAAKAGVLAPLPEGPTEMDFGRTTWKDLDSVSPMSMVSPLLTGPRGRGVADREGLDVGEFYRRRSLEAKPYLRGGLGRQYWGPDLPTMSPTEGYSGGGGLYDLAGNLNPDFTQKVPGDPILSAGLRAQIAGEEPTPLALIPATYGGLSFQSAHTRANQSAKERDEFMSLVRRAGILPSFYENQELRNTAAPSGGAAGGAGFGRISYGSGSTNRR